MLLFSSINGRESRLQDRCLRCEAVEENTGRRFNKSLDAWVSSTTIVLIRLNLRLDLALHDLRDEI